MRPGQLLPAQHCPTLTCLPNDGMMVATVAAEMLDILTRLTRQESSTINLVELSLNSIQVVGNDHPHLESPYSK